VSLCPSNHIQLKKEVDTMVSEKPINGFIKMV
jgi:hypothetical protein